MKEWKNERKKERKKEKKIESNKQLFTGISNN